MFGCKGFGFAGAEFPVRYLSFSCSFLATLLFVFLFSMQFLFTICLYKYMANNLPDWMNPSVQS